MSDLTRTNPLFTRPTMGVFGSDTATPKIAINCKLENCYPLPSAVTELVRDSLADGTRRIYASDLARFVAWGGTIPAGEPILAVYLSEHADTHAVTTLTRWLASLAKAHRSAGHPDTTKSELVKATLRGIRRRHGSALDQAKPLLRDNLLQTVDAIGDGPKAVRDRALLLLGFAGAFRRSELIALNVDDLSLERQGLAIRIRRSKTDQVGAGRRIGIPYARGRHCPVTSVSDWLQLAEIDNGSIFRPVNRHGQIAKERLSGEAVALIVRERVAAIGIDPGDYSGHSLRAGFATSAAQAGISSWKIRAQTGHASDAMLSRYVRDGELFIDNAAGKLL